MAEAVTGVPALRPGRMHGGTVRLLAQDGEVHATGPVSDVSPRTRGVERLLLVKPWPGLGLRPARGTPPRQARTPLGRAPGARASLRPAAAGAVRRAARDSSAALALQREAGRLARPAACRCGLT